MLRSLLLFLQETVYQIMSIATVFTSGTIIRAHQEYEGYLDLVIREEKIAESALPGQFVMIRGWHGDDPILPRPFDIVQVDPLQHTFRLVIKIEGRATSLLSLLKTGDKVQLTGPLGKGIKDFTFSTLGLLVRGVGAAAVVYLAAEAQKRGIRVFTFLSAATTGRLVCRNYLQAVSTHLAIATDDGSEGFEGNAIVLLDRFLAENRVERIYTCGSKRFARHVKKIDAGGVTEGFVFLEGLMACGMGHCHGCAAEKQGGNGYFLVCKDGPDFPVSEVVIP